ncbi:MAG: aminotransferase class IV family protein [Candidatus Puniceispirillum sp.]
MIDFHIFETMRWRPASELDPGGFDRGNAHLRRMASSARRFGLPFDPHAIHAALDNELNGLLDEKRVRIALYEDGELDIDIAEAPPVETGKWRLGLAETRLNADDMWLRHKTSNRRLYEDDRTSFCGGDAPQFDELIYLNQSDELCEGTITSLFIDDGKGILKTPALSCGLLPGILRETMLQSGEAVEAVLTLDDVRYAKGLFVGNSLRGLIPAELAF